MQAAEAEAWFLDKDAKTPVLDSIAKNRGIPPNYLKQKALEKSRQYQALCAKLAGKRQAIEDLIRVATSIDELDLIDINITLS